MYGTTDPKHCLGWRVANSLSAEASGVMLTRPSIYTWAFIYPRRLTHVCQQTCQSMSQPRLKVAGAEVEAGAGAGAGAGVHVGTMSSARSYSFVRAYVLSS